ncbi:MAG: PH domain-containing protein [Verrucomicrobiales bacterium]|nr:PH domain-containing protein [Verrucomicrobiales bacterium]
MNDRYYVFRHGAKSGPFTLHALLDEIDAQRADYEDLCLRIGSDTCEKLREVLDWDDHDIVSPSATVTKPATQKICADRENESEGENESDLIPDVAPSEKQQDLDNQQTDLLDEDSWDTSTPSSSDEEIEDNDQDIDHEETQRPLSRPPRDSTTILYSGRPSLWSYPNSLLFIAISLALGIYFRPQYDWALLAGLCSALLFFMQMQMRRTRHQYYITPKQIELIQGLILVNSREIPIDYIGAIHIRQRGLQGLVGLANIEFATLESPMPILVFHNVRAARQIKDLIRRLQDALEYED